MEIIILFGVVLSATVGIILRWVLHELIAVRKELRAGILEFAAANRIHIARTAIRVVEPGFKATLWNLYNLPGEVKHRVLHSEPIEEWDQEFTREREIAKRQDFSALYATAHAFAEKKHRGQFRDGGKPYITHPEAVAAAFDDGPEKITAILHDVLEDTDATVEEIRAMVTAGGIDPGPIMEALRLMTHAPETPYPEYIKAIAGDPVARRVKLADLKHNMSTLDELPEPRRGLLKTRYVEALDCLNRM